jgi:hypothetical protein
VNAQGLPLGLEIGRDRALLAAARSVEQIIGCLPGPPMSSHRALRQRDTKV